MYVVENGFCWVIGRASFQMHRISRTMTPIYHRKNGKYISCQLTE